MNIIHELRKKKCIQQKELSIAIGVSQPTVSDWEKNKKDPTGENLRKLAQFFGVDELVIMGKGLADQQELPKTIEAQTIADGVDQLPKEDRQKALNVMRAVFVDKFKG